MEREEGEIFATLLRILQKNPAAVDGRFMVSLRLSRVGDGRKAEM